MADNNDHDDLRPEYCREDFPVGLKRGRYAASMAEGSNIVRIDPDLLDAFPDSFAVNEALRALLRVAERSAGNQSSCAASGGKTASSPAMSGTDARGLNSTQCGKA